VKCPRCQLNYINEETEQYCKVCLVDMGKIQGQPELDLDDEEEYKLCPECGENYLEEGEDICFTCRMEKLKQEGKETGIGDGLDFEDTEDVPAEPVEVSLDDMAELESGEAEEEEEKENVVT